MTDSEIKELILDDLEDDKRFTDIKDEGIKNDTLIIFMKQKENNLNCALKVPLWDTTGEQSERTYKIIQDVKDRTHLARLIGTKPLVYAGYKAVLMERADMNLKEFFPSLDQNKNFEEEMWDIIIQLALGNKELHLAGYIYRDPKDTNCLGYKEGGKIIWTVSDFEYASQKRSTRSHQSAIEYSSYELIEQYFKKTMQYSQSTDIFGLGVEAFQGFNIEGTHQTLRNMWPGEEHSIFYDFVMAQIAQLNITKDSKYFLRRMLEIKTPDNLTGKNIKDYRYSTIDMFLEEFHGGPTATPEVKPTELYQTIERRYLSQIEQVTNSNKELLSAGDIVKLANAREEFLKEVNNEIGKYTSKDEVQALLKGNPLDNTIRQRWEKDYEFTQGKLREVIDLKETISSTEFKKEEVEQVKTQRSNLLRYKNPVCNNQNTWKKYKTLVELLPK
ncbi:MAG: protein kinase [Nanoarchaeota archaeon]|nr:protein kinase [Nanoarchaeota archaeon]MBU1854318.1 protein kinase [Nanoarchaeota archaeon]